MVICDEVGSVTAQRITIEGTVIKGDLISERNRLTYLGFLHLILVEVILRVVR